MSLEPHKCLIQLALSNPYYFKKENVQLSFIQKLYVIGCMNRGIIHLSYFHAILLFLGLKLLRKPKYWARNAFFQIYPYTQGALLTIWGCGRYFDKETIELLFQEQLELIKAQNITEQQLLYNDSYIQNKLENHQIDEKQKIKNRIVNSVPLQIYEKEQDKQQIRHIQENNVDQQQIKEFLDILKKQGNIK